MNIYATTTEIKAAFPGWGDGEGELKKGAIKASDGFHYYHYETDGVRVVLAPQPLPEVDRARAVEWLEGGDPYAEGELIFE